MALIRRDAGGPHLVERDPWIVLDDVVDVSPGAHAIVSLGRWRAEREALRARAARVGIQVPGETRAEELARDLEGVALVRVVLPKFTDGRAYTLARLLRSRLAFAGELRVTGDVLRDQLFYLARCGFDAFELPEGADVSDALRAFADFTVTYQPAADHDEPIWRRRLTFPKS